MSIVITGRPISATVANFRQIDWREGGLSFRLLFSPGVVENAPQTAMGNINVIEGTANDVESRPGTAFPTLSFIPVGDALERIEDILSSLANAVALVRGRSRRRGNLGYPDLCHGASLCAEPVDGRSGRSGFSGRDHCDWRLGHLVGQVAAPGTAVEGGSELIS